MLKGGIFLDVENLVRCGGWGVRYRTIRQLVEAQGVEVIRANAYMVIDRDREEEDPAYQRKKQEYRDAVRRAGFHVVLKEIRRYHNSEGDTVVRANPDLDLAVDALLQSQSFDYVMLGTGDGDFLRLVQALQDHGKRVDLLSFSNTSEALRREVDTHYSGYLVPDLQPVQDEEARRARGIMHWVNEEKGFGFLTVRTGLGSEDLREDVFIHINDFEHIDGRAVTNKSFASLKTFQRILEFDTEEQEEGKLKATGVVEFQPELDWA